jgi:hypothetical protein
MSKQGTFDLKSAVNPCKACGAPIFFITTVNRKQMPVEEKPVQGINVDGEMVSIFIPHWGNCKDFSKAEYKESKRFRKDKAP